MDEKKRVLITGGAGFIGSHVAEEFLDKPPWGDNAKDYFPHEVLIVDNLSSGRKENVDYLKKYWRVRFVKEDICNPHQLNQIFSTFMPQIVVHLAAQPSLLRSWQSPTRDAEINIIGTLNLARMSEKYGVKRFVFISTSAAESSWGAYWTEAHAPPSSPYGISKRAAEWYLGKVRSGKTVVILRLANVYGPRQVPLGENQLIPRALAHIYQQEDFSVYGDGEQTRDFIYVKDVARAIYEAATDRYDTGCMFNISTDKQTSVLEVLKIVKRTTKYKGKWETEDNATSLHKLGRRHVEMPDDGFRQMFHWNIETSLEEGIKETIDAWPK